MHKQYQISPRKSSESSSQHHEQTDQLNNSQVSRFAKSMKDYFTNSVNHMATTMQNLMGKPMYKLKNQNLLRETWPKVIWLSSISAAILVFSCFYDGPHQTEYPRVLWELAFLLSPMLLQFMILTWVNDLRKKVNFICCYLFIFQNTINVYLLFEVPDCFNGNSMPSFILYFVINTFIYFAQKHLTINILNLCAMMAGQLFLQHSVDFVLFHFFAFLFIIMEREITMLKIALLLNFQKQILHTLPMGCLIYGQKDKKLLYANRTVEEQVYMDKIQEKDPLGKRQSSFMMDYEGQSKTDRKIQKFISRLIIQPEDKKSFYSNQDDQLSMWHMLQSLFPFDKRKKQYKFICFYQKNMGSPANPLDLISKNKFYFEVLVNTAISYDQQACFMVTLYDITTDFKSSVYQQMNSFKSRLLKSISHELRTRLNIVQGILEILQHRNLAQPDLTNVIYAYNNCRIQSYIVGSIVDYNLIKEGKIQLIGALKDIRELIFDVKSLFLEECQMKSISITITIKPCTSYEIRTDETRLMQVLVNIMSNAVKFTDQTGFIEIILSQNAVVSMDSPPKQIQVETNRSPQQASQQYQILVQQPKDCQLLDPNNVENNYFVIQFKDSGIGINDQTMKMIDMVLEHDVLGMNPEEQDHAQGFMLGLRSSSKTLQFLNQEAQSRSLVIVSQPNFGTTVSMVIQGVMESPLVKMEQMQPKQKKTTFKKKTVKILAASPIADYESQSERFASPVYTMRVKEYFIRKRNTCQCRGDVMIVDDEPFNLVILEAMLRMTGQTVQRANNGYEFIQTFKKRVFQCVNNSCRIFKFVIMDYQMPILNGAQATQQALAICKRQNRSEVIVIGCTAFSNQDDIKELKQAGMKYVCIKPITKQKILDIIKFVESGQSHQ